MVQRIPVTTIVVTILILVAVLLPGASLPDSPGIPGFDKLVHFVMFLILAAAALRDFQLAGRRRVALAIIASLAFSALTEALQLMVDGRSSELVDMAADMAGFIVGIIARRPLAGLLFRRHGA
jgi:VanZ family protein